MWAKKVRILYRAPIFIAEWAVTKPGLITQETQRSNPASAIVMNDFKVGDIFVYRNGDYLEVGFLIDIEEVHYELPDEAVIRWLGKNHKEDLPYVFSHIQELVDCGRWKHLPAKRKKS